jgi:hypothetical protein
VHGVRERCLPAASLLRQKAFLFPSVSQLKSCLPPLSPNFECFVSSKPSEGSGDSEHPRSGKHAPNAHATGTFAARPRLVRRGAYSLRLATKGLEGFDGWLAAVDGVGSSVEMWPGECIVQLEKAKFDCIHGHSALTNTAFEIISFC